MRPPPPQLHHHHYQQQQQQQKPYGTAAGAVLPPLAASLLPPAVTVPLTALLQQRPTLGLSLQDTQGIAVLAGLSAPEQQRVVQRLWALPPPPAGSVVPGLLQMLCR
jgi:hypothetical protein